MLGFVIYGIGYFVVTLLIQYMLFKLRKTIIMDQMGYGLEAVRL